MTSERDKDSLKDVEYLKRFLSKENKSDQQHRTSIVHDKMDRAAMERALQDVDQFKDMENRLAAKFDDHGAPLSSDIFQALNKPVPTVRDEEEMDPKSLIERETIKEMMKLREFEELKDYTTGDPTGAALAGSTMEPKVTEIMEHLKERQDELDELLERLQDEDTELSEEDLEKLLEEWGSDLPRIRSALRDAMRDATDEMDQLEGMARLWGTEPGELKRMPAEERIRLAKKLRNNPQLARLAELIGAFTSFAFAMQHRKTDQLQTDIYDITTGNNLSRVVPSEFALLRRPETRREFHRKYAERGLTQYRLRGREKVGKGGICCAIDTSGSMAGDRDVFAKAVALSLLRIAQRQERTFFGILFDTQTHYKQDLTHATPDQILDFATGFSNGGPLRNDQRVVTPDGWKPISEMQVGDHAIGPDGKPTKVIGVYPQGVLEKMYKVTFSDGAEVVCDDTHLWTVIGHAKRKKDSGTMMLKDIIPDYVRGPWPSTKGGRQYQFSVPVTAPVQHAHRGDLLIEPYLMGYLIGNGCFTQSSPSVTPTPGDENLWAQYLPSGVKANQSENRPGFAPTYRLVAGPRGGHHSVNANSNPLMAALRHYGLWGHDSAGKSIPDDYLWGSVDQRQDLLAGLLDSDGDNPNPGIAAYSTRSEKLAHQVRELAHSLGYLATVNHRPSKRPNERDGWVTAIQVSPDTGCPFRLKRYVATWKDRKRFNRMIRNIEPVDPAECTCIKVDREDGLFLTEDHVVTHNTAFEPPLTDCMTYLNEEHERDSLMQSDIVLITDGYAPASEPFLQRLDEFKQRLGCRIFGVAIGVDETTEPLSTICDGRVFPVYKLNSGTDIADIFKAV